MNPVSGTIKVQGEAPEGALLVFHPVTPITPPAPGVEVPKPVARVKSDGSFQLTTYQADDGAPTGEYTVTFEWRPLVKQDGDVKAGPNVVPTQYTRPEATPIKVTVKNGKNTIEPIVVNRQSGQSSAPSRIANRRIPGED